ncbi:MAG: diguanylate cyclase [Gemmatimonadota bacterium]
MIPLSDGVVLWILLVALLVGVGLWAWRTRRRLADLTERHRYLFERNQACVFRSTVGGELLDANPAAARMYGYDSVDQLARARAADLYPDPSDRAAYLRRLERDGEVDDYLHHHLTREGEDLWVLENATLIETGDGDRQIVGTVVDLTERVQAERRQEAAEERYRALFEQNVAGAFRSEPGGTLLEVNAAFARMLGYDAPDQLEGRDARELYADPGRREDLMDLLDRNGSLQNEEIALRSRDGETVWVLENSFVAEDPETGRPVNIGTATEITEHVREERELEALAHRDPLTGVPNRRFLDEAVPRTLSRSLRDGDAVGLVYVDLDDFKEINDRWGHAAGDAVLRAVGTRLQASVREGDLVGRIGGDEFVVALAGLKGKEDALATTRRVARRAFSSPVEAAGRTHDVSGKLGVACCPEDGVEFEILLQRADRAMYRAARSGRSVAAYDETRDRSRRDGTRPDPTDRPDRPDRTDRGVDPFASGRPGSERSHPGR